MTVPFLDRVFNRIIRICRGLHYRQDWVTGARGRRHRTCMICGYRETEKSLTKQKVEQKKKA